MKLPPYGLRPALAWRHIGRFNTVTPNVAWTKFITVPGADMEERYTGGDGVEALRYRMAVFPEKLGQIATNGALKQLKDQKVNFSVAFAERKRTAKLATDTINRIRKAVGLFRSRHPREFARVLSLEAKSLTTGRNLREGFPNAWLELVYGWKPAVSDVTGALKLLDERNKERPFMTTVRQTAKRMVVENDKPENTLCLLALAGTDWQLMLQFSTYFRATSVLTYIMEDSVLQSAASLGITNPYDTAWELLPLSFVVDWALPIGQYFNLQDADLGMRLMRASLGKRSTCLGACYGLRRMTNYYPYQRLSVSGLESARYRMSEFERDPYAYGVVPQLYLQDPFALPENAQATRLASAVSLLAQAFSRKLRAIGPLGTGYTE